MSEEVTMPTAHCRRASVLLGSSVFGVAVNSISTHGTHSVPDSVAGVTTSTGAGVGMPTGAYVRVETTFAGSSQKEKK